MTDDFVSLSFLSDEFLHPPPIPLFWEGGAEIRDLGYVKEKPPKRNVYNTVEVRTVVRLITDSVPCGHKAEYSHGCIVVIFLFRQRSSQFCREDNRFLTDVIVQPSYWCTCKFFISSLQFSWTCSHCIEMSTAPRAVRIPANIPTIHSYKCVSFNILPSFLDPWKICVTYHTVPFDIWQMTNWATEIFVLSFQLSNQLTRILILFVLCNYLWIVGIVLTQRWFCVCFGSG